MRAARSYWLEFLDFARVVLARSAEIVDGTLTARGPGLGLEWDEAAVAKYLVPPYAAASSFDVGLAVSSIPSAFITAIVVFKVGLPFVLNER